MVIGTYTAQRPGALTMPSTDRSPTTSQPDERELLSRVTARDSQAFETLYYRYASRVRGYLTQSLCPPELVDEVLQDVMLVLWQRAERVPPAVPLLAWLCVVARHKAHKALARASAVPVSQALPENIDHNEPEAVFVRQEQVRALTRALATLPLGERIALELLLYQSCSHQEIAALTGDPVSTVRTRVARARQRLRARLAALDSDISHHDSG